MKSKATVRLRIIPANSEPYVNEMGSTRRYLDCPFCGIEWTYTKETSKK